MVLQNHWVVSCNYNGEIYGVELPEKQADLKVIKLSKEKTAIIRYFTDKCKANRYNQKLYNKAKKTHNRKS